MFWFHDGQRPAQPGSPFGFQSGQGFLEILRVLAPSPFADSAPLEEQHDLRGQKPIACLRLHNAPLHRPNNDRIAPPPPDLTRDFANEKIYHRAVTVRVNLVAWE